MPTNQSSTVSHCTVNFRGMHFASSMNSVPYGFPRGPRSRISLYHMFNRSKCFSRTKIQGMSYPLIDFTSSGLTHSYMDFDGEPNPFRVGPVVSRTSYGTVGINISDKEVHFRIMGENGMVLQELKQTY